MERHQFFQSGSTPLHESARAGRRDIMELLISAKANIQARDGVKAH